MIEEKLWYLIDLQYLTKPEDLRKLALTSKYFYNRLKKSGHLQNKKDAIIDLAKKWRLQSSWNRFNFPPSFKITGSYTETIVSSGSGLFQFHKIPNPEFTKMIAAIWIKADISNFFSYNQNGYTWILGVGNRQADSITLTSRLNKWIKLDFFKGGALFPIDLFIENCHIYCSSDPFAKIKVTWVYTNAKISDIKKYNFEWINSQKKWKGINRNRYLYKDNTN